MRNLLFVVLFLMVGVQTALADVASSSQWGPCSEDQAMQCLYMAGPPFASGANMAAAIQSQTQATQVLLWPVIGILGFAALALVVVWWYSRCARIAREAEEAQLEQERQRRLAERQRRLAQLENELIAAQIAYDRGPSDRSEGRLTRAQIALHRFNHPDQPVVEGGQIVIHAADGYGSVSGAPFLGGPFVVLPAAP